MGLYSIFMTLVTTITILVSLVFEDVYVSLVVFGLLSIIAVPVSDRYEVKKENE